MTGRSVISYSAFGTPTRFGNVAAQLEQFIDQAGTLRREGRLADEVATALDSSQTPHGGPKSTILALNTTFSRRGMVIVPLGDTVREVRPAGTPRRRAAPPARAPRSGAAPAGRGPP